MKHEEIKELLPLYIDNGLDVDEREVVEEHLKKCQECQKALKNYQDNYARLSSLTEEEVPGWFASSLKARLKENELEQKKKSPGWLERLYNLLKTRVRVPAGVLAGALAALVLILVLVYPANYYDKQLELPLPMENKMGDAEFLRSRGNYKMMTDELSLAQNEQLTLNSEMERKIIKNATLRIEVKEIEQINEKIISLLQEVNGYIASSGSWLSAERQHLNFNLRVPVEEFYVMLDKIEKYGRTISRNISGRDVTEEYIDVQARLKNLKLQEEKYRGLLAKASKVEDILKVERELERVRGNIESLQGRMQYLNDQVSLSTINVEFVGPEPVTSSDYNFSKVIRQALREMGNSFFKIIIRLGIILPYVLILLVIYLVYRSYRRKG